MHIDFKKALIKAEREVSCLELSFRLKELKVDQDSLCWWELKKDSKAELASKLWSAGRFEDSISAFTVTELGNMLPEYLKDGSSLNFYTASWTSEDNKRTYGVGYDIKDNTTCYEEADTEANARAKMLIYLLENKLIILVNHIS